ncbi:insulin-like growth factor-binding protein complex acid labile subunit [Drosophila rhopaloa]|uniref:Lumican n=1 Tax=Drosophila rhopaloa TaxID=1041015 RepID=A0ABM5JB18_DRORH|nr:insulin-like growth factor-binding protein complex acid labile subunit [Drosophila rhopaloa]
MNLTRSAILAATIICIVVGHVNCQAKNETSSAKPESPKEKTNVKQSKLCKKCICDFKNSLLDCSEKLQEWLSTEEWEVLTNGNFVFKTINLEHNNLTSISILPKYDVENLYLANNQIDSIAVGAFQNLTELTVLDLSHNRLTSKVLIPDVFKGPYSVNDFEPLGKLKTLNLGYNDLHSLDADLFEHIRYLEELVLCKNSFHLIDQLSETAISGLLSLKTLDVSYMEIEDLPGTILHGPRDLDTLIAAGNLFKHLPKALERATNLTSLVLNENPIESLVGDNVFPPLTKLNHLSMTFMTKLYKIGPGAFSELQSLTELILSDNKFLNEIDEEALSKNVTGGQYLDYPPLEKVYLNNCNMTTLPKPLLVRWDKLKALDLRFNPWTCDASNDYLINVLIDHVNKTTQVLAKNVQCASPDRLKGVEVLRVANEHLVESSSGSLIWVGLLVVLLIAVPTILGAYVMKRRGCFGVFRRHDSVAVRALYNRTSFNEDFHI